MTDTDNKDKLGVNATEKAILSMGWKFRRQLESDYGIDAHIEIKHHENYPTGKLIAVQIKTDTSSISSETGNHFTFNGDFQHLEYWLNHSLPVIIVHYDSNAEKLHWVQVLESAVKKHEKSWSTKYTSRVICHDAAYKKWQQSLS